MRFNSGISGSKALTIPRSVLRVDNVLLFLLPATIGFRINLVGQLLVPDLLVIVVFCIMLAQRRLSLQHPYLKPLMALFLLWFIGAVLSDIVNRTSFENIARGWSRVGLFGIYLAVIANLIKGRRDRFLTAMIGVAVGSLATSALILSHSIDGGVTGTLWRYGFGFAFTIISAAIAEYSGVNRRSVGFLVLAFSPIHLILSARSLFLRTFIAGFFASLALKIKSPRKRKIAASLLVVGILAGFGLGEAAYEKIVTSGALGEAALNKYQTQTQSGENVIIGGRSESLVSLIAIRDRPFLGHGSWADDQKYISLYWFILKQKGLQSNFNTEASRIPSHSVLLASWVENGLGGAIFWFFVVVLTFRAAISGVLGINPASALMFLAIITLLWDIPFSPFGAERRVTLPIFIAAVTIVLDEQRRKKQTRKKQ